MELLERTYIDHLGNLYSEPEFKDISLTAKWNMHRFQLIQERIAKGQSGPRDIREARKCLDNICNAYEGNQKMTIFARGMREFYNTILDHVELERPVKRADLRAICRKWSGELDAWTAANTTTFDRIQQEEGISTYVPDICGGLPEHAGKAPADKRDAESYRRFLWEMAQEQAGSPAEWSRQVYQAPSRPVQPLAYQPQYREQRGRLGGTAKKVAAVVVGSIILILSLLGGIALMGPKPGKDFKSFHGDVVKYQYFDKGTPTYDDDEYRITVGDKEQAIQAREFGTDVKGTDIYADKRVNDPWKPHGRVPFYIYQEVDVDASMEDGKWVASRISSG